MVAGHVKLRATLAAGGVQSDGLCAEEIVAWGKIRGDEDVHHAAAGIEVLGAPVVGGSRGAIGGPSVLEDLEPPSIGSRGGGSIRDGGHVDDYGSIVGATNGLIRAASVTRLLVHLDYEKSK